MPESKIAALPGQHICEEYLKSSPDTEYLACTNCDIKIYNDWCHAGPMIIIDGGLMIRISHCPFCGKYLEFKTL